MASALRAELGSADGETAYLAGHARLPDGVVQVRAALTDDVCAELGNPARELTRHEVVSAAKAEERRSGAVRTSCTQPASSAIVEATKTFGSPTSA